jgi:hypothetical protein
MVKITNGVSVFEVTRGAFDGIYSHQGYKIVNESKSAQADKAPDNTDTRTDDEKFADELVEKPVSQWNKEEVKRFAALKEIDISGTKNANEAKEIIKQFLAQQ